MLLRHGDGVVHMVHHGGIRQQTADQRGILPVEAHQLVGPAGKARAGELLPAPPLPDGSQWAEGGPAEIMGLEILDGAFGALLVVHDDILQAAA